MGDTTGPDLMLMAYNGLDSEEQEEVFERISQARLERLAGDESETSRFLGSLKRVAEHVGGIENLNSVTYRQAWRELRDRGEEVHSLSPLLRHFGSWRLAREALDLSETTTARRIDARFANRRLSKVFRYTEESLREAVDRCIADIGHVPQLAAFDHWRQRELEKARAEGNDALHIPSEGPYRRRYGGWDKALVALGYTPDRVAERLERQ